MTFFTQVAVRSGIVRAGLISLVLSLIINHALRLVAVVLLNPIPEFVALTAWMPVTLFTTIGVVGAIGLYALLRRLTPNHNRLFRQIALVALVLSCIPNIWLGLSPESAPAPGVTLAGMIALMLMHFPPALLSIWQLTGRN